MQKIVIYTDGGSRGNPGPAGIGVVVCNEKGEALKKYSEYLGSVTNNEAEYQAIIFALKKIKLLFGKTKAKKMSVEIRSDSELVVKQMNHKYKIQEDHIQEFFIKTWNLMLDFGQVEFVHIGREKNKEADLLVNQAMDSHQKSASLF